MKDKVFPCTSCGGCCSIIGRMLSSIEKYPLELRTELEKFPYKTDEVGVCEMLTEDKKCKIYKKRPLICNINRTFEKIYKGNITRRHFYKKNINMCNEIIDSLNIDKQFKIN